MPNSYINNYSYLFDRIVENLDSKIPKFEFENAIDYKELSEYSSRFLKHRKSKYIFYEIHIPGNLCNRVYFVEDYEEDLPSINGYYNVNGNLVYVMCMNTKIMYEKDISLKELTDFLIKFRLTISDIITDYVFFSDKLNLTMAAAMHIVIRNFNNAKDILNNAKRQYKFSIPLLDDNLIYENIVKVFANRTRDINDALILRAIEDGSNNVESGIVFKTRLMS